MKPFFGPFEWTDDNTLVMFVGDIAGIVFWCLWSFYDRLCGSRKWWAPAMLLLLLIAIPIGYLDYWGCAGFLGDKDLWAEMQRQS